MTRRIQQINQLIKQELSQIILREIDFPEDILVTITRVKTSIDLKRARVYISMIPASPKGRPENNISEVFQALNREIYNLQQKINKRLQIKTVPKIEFIEEKEISKAARIEELLEKIYPIKSP